MFQASISNESCSRSSKNISHQMTLQSTLMTENEQTEFQSKSKS